MGRFKFCPACGAAAPLVRETRRMKYRYKGETLAVRQPGDWCRACGEAVLNHADVQATEDKLNAWRQRINKEIAVMIKRVRKELGLTQEEMAEIVGGGKKAFAKYESGTVVPSEAMIRLIRLLGKRPELLMDLRSMKKAA